ncbi:MAG TPA: substrate-binding domain-containing protein [Alphaproteobacteria bacterium]|jgi:ABC-type branched-subunit amino acid transport system substrate-binding protein|nr:substrate-binding domain-containing protein [Alphaproteobacteria bacterium]
MTSNIIRPSRRQFVGGALGAAALSAMPALARRAAAADDFKIGLFIALSGPASLFGPTQKACAELAADEVNKAGGIMGRKVVLIPTDAGVPPAEAAKSAVRLMLNDKVDAFIGSHDSAVRQALVATIKGKTPYVYTPVYEGTECARNTYVLADTPEQQVRPAITYLTKAQKLKKFYLIGDDYVWPQKLNLAVKKYVNQLGGEVMAEEYVPFGPGNKFEDAVTRIKAAAPDMVVITLVGGDNVNFNRTFAGFGLAKSIKRLSFLLEENTLAGIGAESSANLYSSMSYFANLPTPENKAFIAAYKAKFGDKAPPMSLIGQDCYVGVKFVKAMFEKAKSSNAAKLTAAAEGLSFDTPGGPAVMHHRHLDKNEYLAECKGASFDIIQTFKSIKSGENCA